MIYTDDIPLAGTAKSTDATELVIEPRQRDLCLTCNRSKATCFCKYTKPFDTRTRFVILMHPKEYKRQRTGTGRVTRLSLTGSMLFVGEDFTHHAQLNALLADETLYPMLLFPGEKALNLSTALPSEMTARVPLVIIIDATWASARKIVRLSENLAPLRRVTFDCKDPSGFVIKRQPDPAALSTIEATFHILDIFNEKGFEDLGQRHHALLETLATIVDFQLRCAADPNLPSHRLGKVLVGG